MDLPFKVCSDTDLIQLYDKQGLYCWGFITRVPRLISEMLSVDDRVDKHKIKNQSEAKCISYAFHCRLNSFWLIDCMQFITTLENMLFICWWYQCVKGKGKKGLERALYPFDHINKLCSNHPVKGVARPAGFIQGVITTTSLKDVSLHGFIRRTLQIKSHLKTSQGYWGLFYQNLEVHRAHFTTG